MDVALSRETRVNLVDSSFLVHEICIVINARSIKAHYGLGTKNYRMNKQRAVQWATEFSSLPVSTTIQHANSL